MCDIAEDRKSREKQTVQIDYPDTVVTEYFKISMIGMCKDIESKIGNFTRNPL